MTPSFYRTSLHGAGKDDRAFVASFAEIEVALRHLPADNADIVQVRLDAVIRATTDGDLEFVWQGDLAKALIEALVDLCRESLCIDVTKHADRALTSHYRTNFCSCTPSPPRFLWQRGPERWNVRIRNARQLNCQPRRE